MSAVNNLKAPQTTEFEVGQFNDMNKELALGATNGIARAAAVLSLITPERSHER